MGKQLFSEFGAVSAKQWKQQIQMDLKGADYNDTLVWESLEGLHIKPFYHAEDLAEQPLFSTGRIAWNMGQRIVVEDPLKANTRALDALARGAQSLFFSIPRIELAVGSLFDGIDLTKIPVHLEFGFLDASTITGLLGSFPANSLVCLHIDLIGNLNRSGNWYHDMSQDHAHFDAILAYCERQGITHVIGCDMTQYQHAGANCIQQLAYGVAHANEYLNHLKGLNKTAGPISFQVAVGSNYFFEIAKLRALRWLWQSLSKAHGNSVPCHIVAQPSLRNKTLYDYNVNMLRTTSEFMAAALGGADTICSLRYDHLYHDDNEFGDRIARNQLIILQKESFLASASTHSDGAYYIETLTHQLAQKGLDLFKQIEHGGGFLQQLKKGIIQKKIKASAQKEQRLFDEGKLVSIGTNKYPNASDAMGHDLERDPFMASRKTKTIVEPIIAKRLAETIEKERLANETKKT
ncbi:MAG: methylmalonyl-CoA mutase [Flavobacteriaceae bacterium]|nr:methylmalonyl-CoA mutase [Flavobacteriaceae bacterium]